jgi:hypothetical protein
MKRSLVVLILVFTACVPTAPVLEHGTARVFVADAGFSCGDRCTTASQLCGAMFDLSVCQSGCDEPRAACLDAAGFDCFALRRCARPAPTRPFDVGTAGTGVKDLAGDFTLATTHGPWTFSQEWTGDDSYVFLLYAPSTSGLFQQPLDVLLSASPRNVHYVFGWVSDQAGFDAARAQWETALSVLPVADRAHWLTHVHFVTQRFDLVTAWPGQMISRRIATPPMYLGNGLTAFAIDRFQRIREVGMLGRLGGSGLSYELELLANEPKAFEFEFAREQRLQAEQATVVTIASSQIVHDTLETDVLLPDPTGFDTLEVDLSIDCPQHSNSLCGAWDYLSHLRLCDAPGMCTRELARWITPYWREGRWVTDISAQLAVLPSGPARLQWWASGQWDPRTTDYTVSLSLRYSNSGRGMRPVSATPLWTGGDWNASYDSMKAPVNVLIPADARKVELVTLTTGHGGVQPTNCAEFCNHAHHFVVNGVEHVQSFPGAQTASGCADRVALGVVPNQHGTWYYGRGGWCPGEDVAPWVVDVTADVTKGQMNTLSYTTRFNGAPVNAGLGNIVLSSWLVVWK